MAQTPEIWQSLGRFLSCGSRKAEQNDTKHCEEAVKEELPSLEANKVWQVVGKPPSSKLLKFKSVFPFKEHANDNPKCYKARHVAKCVLQKYGEDCFQIYAPVAKFTRVRVVRETQKVELTSIGCQNYDFVRICLKEHIYLATLGGVNKMNGKSLKLATIRRCWNEKFNEFLPSHSGFVTQNFWK